MDKVITRSLPVKLTQREHVDRARTQGRLIREVLEAKQDKKDAAAKAKLEIETMEAKATMLGRVLESGEENRDVECYEHINRLDGLVEVVRRDTGEIVDTRALTPGEKQLAFEQMTNDE